MISCPSIAKMEFVNSQTETPGEAHKTNLIRCLKFLSAFVIVAEINIKTFRRKKLQPENHMAHQVIAKICQLIFFFYLPGYQVNLTFLISFSLISQVWRLQMLGQY